MCWYVCVRWHTSMKKSDIICYMLISYVSLQPFWQWSFSFQCVTKSWDIALQTQTREMIKKVTVWFFINGESMNNNSWPCQWFIILYSFSDNKGQKRSILQGFLFQTIEITKMYCEEICTSRMCKILWQVFLWMDIPLFKVACLIELSPKFMQEKTVYFLYIFF